MTQSSFTLMDPATLPTHLARVVGRVNQAGCGSASETFLLTSYVVETTIKTLGVALCAGLRQSSTTALYRFEYNLVRGDGLGDWDTMIRECVSQSYSGYVHKDIQPLLNWFTQRRTKPEDEWARKAAEDCASILTALGEPSNALPSKLNLRHLINQLVRVRNKTKAHGAVGENFFSVVNPPYLSAIRSVLTHCPLFQWEWFFLAERTGKRKVKAVRLRGASPTHVPEREAEGFHPPQHGVYFRTSATGEIQYCGDLLQTDWECHKFLLPNGGMSETGRAEFLDYATGETQRTEMARLLAPPAPPPPSATEGMPVLDIFSNVFGNLPPLDSGYVERPRLQQELRDRIEDTNHPIITLHGRGGIGKTSLALHLAHRLAGCELAKFDHILWLSARDLELKPGGTSEVRRAIPNVEDACRLLAELLSIEPTPDAFAQVLQNPSSIGSPGILFIFDNFETLDDPRGVFRFLDTHAHVPNKVLITSRERAFKGDYPIEVGGMEFAEASVLLRREAQSLGITGIINDNAIREIYENADGHAYVMRVVVGEIARDKRWVPLKSLVPRRSDLLSAVFERSFNKLTPDGRWVFLSVANWRSVVSELALLVVLGMRNMDVEAGLEECLDLSLISRSELNDGQSCYYAPGLARVFARKKLDGDPDRLAIMEDLQILQEFGAVRPDQISNVGVQQMITDFVQRAQMRVVSDRAEEKQSVDRLLTRVAELWPIAWLDVARFRERHQCGKDEVAYAFRRAVEECPYEKEVWLARAEYALSVQDEDSHIASLVSAADLDPKDADLLRDAALHLCKYIDAHKSDIPEVRRGVYLASVRSHMERIADKLDATGLSRLAWLFLLEGDKQNGWKYANRGLEKESTNSHCLKIVERLNDQGLGGYE